MSSPGDRFRKKRYRVTVIFRHDGHPASFDYYYKEDFDAKIAEVSREMDRRHPSKIKYAYACGGELEHTPEGTVFHNWHQVTTGFPGGPKFLYGNAPRKPGQKQTLGEKAVADQHQRRHDIETGKTQPTILD